MSRNETEELDGAFRHLLRKSGVPLGDERYPRLGLRGPRSPARAAKRRDAVGGRAEGSSPNSEPQVAGLV